MIDWNTIGVIGLIMGITILGLSIASRIKTKEDEKLK